MHAATLPFLRLTVSVRRDWTIVEARSGGRNGNRHHASCRRGCFPGRTSYMLSSVEHRLASLIRQETSRVVSVATQLSRRLARSEERTDVNWYSSAGEVVLDADGR